MVPLDIYAGPGALQRLQQDGFHPLLFDYFLGASGGPKWFVLAGLDRVIFPEFFSDYVGQMQVIGSSAGAFRAACLTQNDPLAAINRLADKYAHTVYSAKPTTKEVTDTGRDLLQYMLGPEGALEIIANPRFKAHFVVAKCHGLMGRHSRTSQFLGLASSAALNTVSRKKLQRLYSRFVFSAPGSEFSIKDPYGLTTQFVELGFHNVADSLLASGSIPMVLDGIDHIVGAPEGIYRDGGIIDYHFDLRFGPSKGLTLYPHFYPKPTPGWFDKGLKRRLPHQSSYYNTVMLVPSAEFVASLPYGKIPDRKDFETMDDATRIQYWETVLNETDRLGEDFMRSVGDGSIMDRIKPLPFECLP